MIETIPDYQRKIEERQRRNLLLFNENKYIPGCKCDFLEDKKGYELPPAVEDDYEVPDASYEQFVQDNI